MFNWLGIILILIILTGLLSTLSWYKRTFSPHPEVVRKLLHIGMGLAMLPVPWLFDTVWPALVLVVITAPALLALRTTRLKSHWGAVLSGVGRRQSLGEIYFVGGVAGLFFLTGDDPLRFSIPILLLALADAAAALIGIRYGRRHYTTFDGDKTLEGSLAFLVTAFFCIQGPLLLFSSLQPVETLFIALLLSLLLMMIEAVAWRGLDNLFIPVVGFLLLDGAMGMSIGEIFSQLALTVPLAIFTIQVLINSTFTVETQR
ncbi:MAG: hypothetical protein H6632_07670 [Anaerolineales bacterium]|nr:hypothetical protein [Anaerolineales bacterium]